MIFFNKELIKTKKHRCFNMFTLLFSLLSLNVYSTELSKIDTLVEKALADFKIPGAAVAIVKNDKVILSKGYGYKDLENNIKVDKNTLFQIASNSKSMTAAALSILIDEGRLNWNDKVIDHLPQFKLFDPYVTREFTIIDLLTHRSGLPLGAGDLLFFPNADKTSVADVYNAMAAIEPTSSFRSEFAYDNQLYILAGEVVAKISGMPWSEFIESKLFPLMEIEGCFAQHSNVPKNANQAIPYVYLDNKFSPVDFMNDEIGAPAGGVNCSVEQLTKWLFVQLNQGKSGNETDVFSKERHQEMLSPVTIVRNKINKETKKVDTLSYALGWFISEKLNHQIIYHGGGLGGMYTQVLLVPELDMGVLIFTNQQNGPGLKALESGILEILLNVRANTTYQDYVALNNKGTKGAEEAIDKLWQERNATSKPSLALEKYAQSYEDSWYGEVKIKMEGNKLRFLPARSKGLKGTLKHYQYNTFVVEFDDRALMADAYVNFVLSAEGEITEIKMKAFDPRTDFSYDFHHLKLIPKVNN
ncbi:MAG: serine hydrolase [Colwellia sp.]